MAQYKVINLRTKREYAKSAEEVELLKASPVYKPGNYQIIELKKAEAPKEAVEAVQKPEKQ